MMETTRNPKRRCNYWLTYNKKDTKSDNPASSHPDTGLPEVLMLMTGATSSYIRAGGCLGSYQLSNTCVLDSILAALHICYIKYPIIQSLLQSNEQFRLIMSYLNCENYDDAKILWLRNLTCFPRHNNIDIAGTVKNHLPMFAKLVCAEVHYRQETPTHRPIYETTLNKFRAFGNLKALGDESNPALILVDCDVDVRYQPPDFCVKDDFNRIFELDFLLLGRDTHMVMCFSFSDKWILYDDGPDGAAFQLFNYKEDLQHYNIYLAGYVNKTEEQEYNYSIPETGLGAMPFHLGPTQQRAISSVEPMEDLQNQFSNLQCGSASSQD